MKRRLTRLEKLIRKKYTKQDKRCRTWLVVDHQSFMVAHIDVPGETDNKDYASWRRDMMAVALARMCEQAWPHRPNGNITCGYCAHELDASGKPLFP